MCCTSRPRSSTRVLRPWSHSSFAAQPPEIPEPMTMASYVRSVFVTPIEYPDFFLLPSTAILAPDCNVANVTIARVPEHISNHLHRDLFPTQTPCSYNSKAESCYRSGNGGPNQ